jgi:hypothetical protein
MGRRLVMVTSFRVLLEHRRAASATSKQQYRVYIQAAQSHISHCNGNCEFARLTSAGQVQFHLLMATTG